MPAARKVVLDSNGTVVASTPPFEPTRPEVTRAMAPGPPKEATFKPWEYRMSRTIRDPLYQALNFQWSDRQQIGRATYDRMYQHAAVAAPFDSLLAFLKSYRPVFKPQGNDPDEDQKTYADFANEQIRRLGSTGDSRQGYERLIDGIGQGLKYGFSLAEMDTIQFAWRGQSRVQIRRIIPLPQSSLDNNYTVLQEFAAPFLGDSRYRCFQMDNQGSLISARQYWSGGGTEGENYTEWTGPELLRLLHFTHMGTEGNPYGQSIFFTAFAHWASLYSLEQMEDTFLDSSLPYLTVSYKTPDGRPSPALHEQFLETIRNQDPSVRALIMPDTTFGSTAPSNPSFTEHASLKKAELRRYIHNCILGIPVVNSEAGNELDARNATSTFFTYLLPGILREISTYLEAQFARRLIDANWSNLADSDYPKVAFQSPSAGNELRVALPLIQQITPFVDSSRLGEMYEAVIPGFDRDWIPSNHSASVMEKRAPSDPAVGAKSKTVPTKPEGTPDTKHDGESTNIGQKVAGS